MESAEVTLRKLEPQPIGTTSVSRFTAWRDDLLKELRSIEALRAAHHPIGPRLKNMELFIKQQASLLSRIEGRKVAVQAGKFHWFLCKLLQRQQGMKARIALHNPNDPFIKELDPSLKKRIRAGWSLLTTPPAFDRMVARLTRAVQGKRRGSS